MADVYMKKLTIGSNTYTIPIPTKISELQNDRNYTSNVGTITSVVTTAGAHTAINTTSGAVSFNVPTTAAHVGAATADHSHGNITNGGDITATAPTIAKGDQIIINDHSASEITNGPTFDGSTTTKALTPKGTWETFLKSYTETDPIFSASAAAGITSTDISNWNAKTSNVGTVTKITAGVGLNTTSNDTTTDGGDITISGTLYLSKTGVSAGSYGPSSNAEPDYGANFNVPYITVDKYGRVTAIATKTVKIPVSDNTNTTYSLSNALASHTFTETLTAGGSGSGTSTAAMTFAAGTGIELTDDTTNKKITIKNIGVTSITTSAGAHSTKSSATGAVSFSVPTKTSHLTNDSDYTTKNYVDTAIANLPEPMIFKGSLGTGGTITSLPAAATTNEGYTYKVITEGTYASQDAKVGDTFISDGSAWILIPSGDEPSGTVTSVKVQGSNGLTGSGTVTDSGTITISHADTSSQESVPANGRRYITAITLDGYGHVTSLSTGTETVVNTDEKIKLTTQSTAGSYPLIFGPTSITSNSTYQGYYNTNITYNPNTKELSTGGKINGYTLAAASAKSVDTTIGAASTSGNLPTSAAVASFVEGKGYITSYTNTTYSLTQDSSDGHKITLTPSSGTAQTITIPDTNTWRGIQNSLTSTSTTDSLSAYQGKILNESKLSLTGGNVTGPVTFGDSVTIDEATIGDLIVNGNGNFTNNLQVNTINGVAVGSNPKFTDLNYYHGEGSWSGLTYTFAKLGGAPDLSFTLPITVSTNAPSGGKDGDLWFTYS